MGCFPVEPAIMPLDVIPADRTARCLVDLAIQGPAVPGANKFHVSNPVPATLDLPVRLLRWMGYSFQQLPYSMWRERLVSCTTEDNALR